MVMPSENQAVSRTLRRMSAGTQIRSRATPESKKLSAPPGGPGSGKSLWCRKTATSLPAAYPVTEINLHRIDETGDADLLLRGLCDNGKAQIPGRLGRCGSNTGGGQPLR